MPAGCAGSAWRPAWREGSSAVGALSWHVEIGGEAVDATLATVAGLLVASERAGRVEAVEGVRPYHPGLHGADHLEDAAPLLGPHPGRQAVWGVVRLLDRLVGRPEGEHREDRPEDLLLRDAVALADPGEEGRPVEVAPIGELAVGLEDLGSLLDPRLDQLLDLGQLAGGVDGPHVGVLVERLSHPQRGEAGLELFEERRVDRLLDEPARPGAAHLALVE